MRISTNNIGNYGPGYSPEVKAKPRTNNDVALNALQKKGDINNDEKKFFSELYPEKKNEIADYHFYQKSGKMSGVALGSLFDKRG